MKTGWIQWLKVQVVGWLGAALLRLLNSSLSWSYGGAARDREFIEKLPHGSIFVFWHNQQLLMPFAYRAAGGKPGGIFSLISLHRDGRYIARASEILGCGSVAGSSSRGGSAALRRLARIIRSGKHVAITPDGPRGPIYEAKPGALQLAQITGARIYPVSYAAERCWRLGSWDKMMVPKPFSRVALVIGEALKLDRHTSLEEQLRIFQQGLEETTAKADELLS